MEENQIALDGVAPVAAHEDAIEIPERAGVGELGELAVCEVAFMKKPLANL